MISKMVNLFSSTSTDFSTNGIGSLKDAILCKVTEGCNSEYELEMEYPINGQYYSEILLRRIIFTKPNPYSEPQPFRIYGISKPINGIVTVNASHISYDLSGYPLSPFEATSINTAFANVKSSSAIECPFTFYTNKNTTGNIKISKPTSIRSVLGNEIINTYGGEYEFDNFIVKLHDKRGQNRGMSIRYGKNLIDLKQEENCASVYTGVYPYWYSDSKGLIQLDSKIINAPGTYNFTKIYPLDLSQNWQDPPTQEQLLNDANLFMITNNIGVPKVSIDVSFVQIGQTEEYKNIAVLETIKLCDQVTVEFIELGVMGLAKCIKTVYNVLETKYDSIVLGDAVSTLASSISDNIKNTNKKIEETKVNFGMEVDTIKIGLADINDAMINKANIKELEAGIARIGIIEADIAGIDNIFAGNITADMMKARTITAGSSVIDDAAIGSAQILDLDIAKLKSGTIDTSKINLASPDGRMTMQNNSILAYDYINNDPLQPYLRTQMGRLWNVVDSELVPRKDTLDNYVYGFEVRDDDGQTVMIDGQGVHNAGITDGAVDNAKVSPNANIDGAKLDVESVITEINNGDSHINGSRVVLTDKTLDVEINDIKINVTYKVDIISTNGNIFKGESYSTTLLARVYHGSVDVTDTIEDNRFRWTRISNDSASDNLWNTSHYGGTKQISVTKEDILSRATFQCVILDTNLN